MIRKHKIQRDELLPSVNISKIKHPKGKPIEINLFDLKLAVAPSYLSQVGITSDGKLAMGNDKVHEVTLFFNTKDTSGWVHLGNRSSLNLYKALQKIYAKNKKGYALRRYSEIDITHKKAGRVYNE